MAAMFAKFAMQAAKNPAVRQKFKTAVKKVIKQSKKDKNRSNSENNEETEGNNNEETEGDNNQETEGDNNEETEGNNNQETEGDNNQETEGDNNQETVGNNKKSTKPPIQKSASEQIIALRLAEELEEKKHPKSFFPSLSDIKKMLPKLPAIPLPPIPLPPAALVLQATLAAQNAFNKLADPALVNSIYDIYMKQQELKKIELDNKINDIQTGGNLFFTPQECSFF
jgi:DNA mismatch repair ATPase MutL